MEEAREALAHIFNKSMQTEGASWEWRDTIKNVIIESGKQKRTMQIQVSQLNHCCEQGQG